MIFVIKHIDIEGPGTIGDFFEKEGYKLKVIDLSQGEGLPILDEKTEAVISLGGPMNVYEEERYPFLKDENVFINSVLKSEVPFLGICLGSQLLAKACGARISKAPVKEVGFMPVQLTAEGKKDILFQGVGDCLEVFQWHEDMFEVPKGGRLLGASAGCPGQAFRMGLSAYGLQFHIEITEKSIEEWAGRYLDLSQEEHKISMAEMLRSYYEKKEVFQNRAELIYNNFLYIMSGKQR